MNECMTGHVPTRMNNPANLCTEVISGGTQRDSLVTQILYNITTVWPERIIMTIWNEAPEMITGSTGSLVVQLNTARAFIFIF